MSAVLCCLLTQQLSTQYENTCLNPIPYSLKSKILCIDSQHFPIHNQSSDDEMRDFRWVTQTVNKFTYSLSKTNWSDSTSKPLLASNWALMRLMATYNHDKRGPNFPVWYPGMWSKGTWNQRTGAIDSSSWPPWIMNSAFSSSGQIVWTVSCIMYLVLNVLVAQGITGKHQLYHFTTELSVSS